MRQLFRELAEDEMATDSESPFDIIKFLNDVLKSDKVNNMLKQYKLTYLVE